MIHGPNIPVSYAIFLFTASDLASVTIHIHNWVLFLPWSHPFILSGVISPLIFISILGTYRPGEFLFQYTINLPFPTVHGVLKARILKWFAIPFSSGPYSVRPLHHDPIVLGGPTWHVFELERTVVLWSDWLVFCDYGFSVSALWCPLATPTVLLGFLLPWTWGISSRLLQQSAAAAPYLGGGISSHCCPSDLEHGVVPLSPPAPCSSCSLELGLLLSATAPVLRRVEVCICEFQSSNLSVPTFST